MNFPSEPTPRWVRVTTLASLVVGLGGGLLAFAIGVAIDQRFRLALPGGCLAAGTMMILAAFGLAHLQGVPSIKRRQLSFRSRADAPVRFWAMLLAWLVGGVYLVACAVMMFGGWEPEDMKVEPQQNLGQVSSEPAPEGAAPNEPSR